MPSSSPAAVLAAMTDHVERYREEVAQMADTLAAEARVAGQPDAHAELIGALYEAERALRIAARALSRAGRTG